MKIIFHKIRWKNFLSTGNAFNEINIEQARRTLIIGKNGSGKSTLADCIAFTLYNRPYRNISKTQLLNTINGKDALCEIEFTIGSNYYLVRRGIKPNIFEIYKNKVLVNQPGDNRDYQRHLETNILRLSYRTFAQLVILGSASYVPFMRLQGHQRRQVTEELLDVDIFSTMNVLLKQRLQENKQLLQQCDVDIQINQEKIDLQLKHIAQLQQDKKLLIDRCNQAIDQLEQKNAILEDEIKTAHDSQKQLEHEYSQITSVKKKCDALNQAKVEIKQRRRQLIAEIQFYEETAGICPTCKQEIAEDFKDRVVNQHKAHLTEIDDNTEALEQKLQTLQEQAAEQEKLRTQIEQLKRQIWERQTLIKQNNKMIDDYQKQVKDHVRQSGTIDQVQGNINLLKQDKQILDKNRSDIINDKSALDYCQLLLKDGGVKARIIKKYIPIFNKFINANLYALNFFCNFELNESFEETIKSRYRDDFSYESFSEGEKMRLDLAILFAWLQVVRLKNSVSTNLILFDEVFDSSLDYEGIDSFFKLIEDMEVNYNMFVISHKNDMIDKFENVIKFEKVQNFSQITGV